MQRKIPFFNKISSKQISTVHLSLTFNIYIAYIIHIHIYIFTDVYAFFHADIFTTSSLRTALVTKKFAHNSAHGKWERECNKKEFCTFQLLIILRLYVCTLYLFITTTLTFISVHFNNRLTLTVYRHPWVS